MPLSKYGDADHPIRISSLSNLQRCPGFTVLRDQYLALTPQATMRGSSVASDTGTAIHRGIELWHRGSHVTGALAAVEMQVQLAEEGYAQADMKRVRVSVEGYANDERNETTSVLTSAMEMTVNLVLDPYDLTPTDQGSAFHFPIHLVGHIDQLRFTPQGGLELWDLKAGRSGGASLVREYCWQQSAYTLATAETLGQPIGVGGVIRMRDYELKRGRGPVFYRNGWTLAACRSMMSEVVSLVVAIRQGEVGLYPGDHCAWCPCVGGPGMCHDVIERI